MSHGECLSANPREMQMSKRHKVLLRILCMLTVLKKIAILSFSSFTVRQILFCFVIHERFPLISLRNGSELSPENIHQDYVQCWMFWFAFSQMSCRVTAPCLRGNCYFSKERSNIYLLISQCIPPWPFLASSRGFQDWDTVYYKKEMILRIPRADFPSVSFTSSHCPRCMRAHRHAEDLILVPDILYLKQKFPNLGLDPHQKKLSIIQKFCSVDCKTYFKALPSEGKVSHLG